MNGENLKETDHPTFQSGLTTLQDFLDSNLVDVLENVKKINQILKGTNEQPHKGVEDEAKITKLTNLTMAEKFQLSLKQLNATVMEISDKLHYIQNQIN